MSLGEVFEVEVDRGEGAVVLMVLLVVDGDGDVLVEEVLMVIAGC